MRRAGPILIIVIGVLALLVDFAKVPIPSLNGEDAGTSHYLETKLGLDLQGGLRIEYQVLPAEGKTPTRDDLGVLRQVIINRVDKSGVAEPQVVIQGNDRVIVEMPGIQNADQIRNLVGTTGRLDFVPLGQTPATQGQALNPAYLAQRCDADHQVNCVLFSGDQDAAASIGANQAGQRNVGDYFAIVLDGKVITAPVINSAIPGGQVQIEQNSSIGGYPLAEAQNLVTILQFGQLPFGMQELANTTVSPTLGEAFLHQSLIAGLIAIVMVIFFMVVHYRLPGVVASGALIYYALFAAMPRTGGLPHNAFFLSRRDWTGADARTSSSWSPKVAGIIRDRKPLR